MTAAEDDEASTALLVIFEVLVDVVPAVLLTGLVDAVLLVALGVMGITTLAVLLIVFEVLTNVLLGVLVGVDTVFKLNSWLGIIVVPTDAVADGAPAVPANCSPSDDRDDEICEMTELDALDAIVDDALLVLEEVTETAGFCKS